MFNPYPVVKEPEAVCKGFHPCFRPRFSPSRRFRREVGVTVDALFDQSSDVVSDFVARLQRLAAKPLAHRFRGSAQAGAD